jgi:hypothetical protein
LCLLLLAAILPDAGICPLLLCQLLCLSAAMAAAAAIAEGLIISALRLLPTQPCWVLMGAGMDCS